MTIVNDFCPNIKKLFFCYLGDIQLAISENQGLDRLRSVSKLRKISGPANLDFFQVYGINLAIIPLISPWKKSRFAGPDIFLRFETDLNFSRPWFSEIKVQIKRPMVGRRFGNLKGIEFKCSTVSPRPILSSSCSICKTRKSIAHIWFYYKALWKWTWIFQFE